MTVNELFNSLTFEEVFKALQRTHRGCRSLKCESSYKGAFDELCDTIPSGNGGEVTFSVTPEEELDETDSIQLLAFDVEGNFWENIVGMDVVAPEERHFTDAELAGAILWGATFYGFGRHSMWEPREKSYSRYGEMKERLERKLYRPYIRAKAEIKRLKDISHGWYGNSYTMEMWDLIHFRQKHQNRMKRKRYYRIKNRIKQLRKLDLRTRDIENIKATSGISSHPIYDRILSAASIGSIWYESHRSQIVPRTDYLIDLLSNYKPTVEESFKEAAEVVVVIYTSKENAATQQEIATLTEFFTSRLNIPITIIPATDPETGPDMWLQFIGIHDKPMDDEDDD